MESKLYEELYNCFIYDLKTEWKEQTKALVDLINFSSENKIKICPISSTDICNISFSLDVLLCSYTGSIELFNSMPYVMEYQYLKSILPKFPDYIKNKTRYNFLAQGTVKDCKTLQSNIRKFIKDRNFDNIKETDELIELYAVLMMCLKVFDDCQGTACASLVSSLYSKSFVLLLANHMDKDSKLFIHKMKSLNDIIYLYISYQSVFSTCTLFMDRYEAYLQEWKHITNYVNRVVDNYNKKLKIQANPSSKALRNIKKRIKKLNSEIHEYKANIPVETVKVNEKIKEETTKEIIIKKETTLAQKCKKLKRFNILVLTNIKIQGDELNGVVDIVPLKNYKSLNISNKYDYVVKLTKGIKHSVGFLIDSLAEKANAKIITTDRTNALLILDAIYNEL